MTQKNTASIATGVQPKFVAAAAKKDSITTDVVE